jgi:signal transduction histidine kinase
MFGKWNFRKKLILGYIILMGVIVLNLTIWLFYNNYEIRYDRMNNDLRNLKFEVEEMKISEMSFKNTGSRDSANVVNVMLHNIISKKFQLANSGVKFANEQLDVVYNHLYEYQNVFNQFVKLKDQERALEEVLIGKSQELSDFRYETENIISNVRKFSQFNKSKAIVHIYEYLKSDSKRIDKVKEHVINEIIEMEENLKNYENESTSIEEKLFLFEIRENLLEQKEVISKIKIIRDSIKENSKNLEVFSEKVVNEFDNILEAIEINNRLRFKLYSIIILSISILAGVVAMYLSIYLYRKISTKFEDFIKATNSIVLGDYTTTIIIEDRSQDEFSELGRNFNKMINEIKNYREEIIATNEMLEQKVLDRTSEIQTALTKLSNAQIQLVNEKETAQKANESKSEFLANMSHELRTPLTSIIGFSNLLFSTETDEAKKYKLNLIITAGNSLLELINDILDLSKIEVGMMKIVEEPVNFKKFVEEIKEFYSNLAQIKQNTFNVVDELIHEQFFGDQLRLKQIVGNLVSNSNKFTEKGEITFKIKEEKVNSLISKIILEVTDNGIGISQDKLDNLFEKFNQGEKHLTKKYGGSGIGLAIVKNLVDLMGGEIFVTSKSNEGTKFIIEIPLKVNKNIFEEARIDLKNKKISPPELKGIKALYMENSESNIITFSEYIRGTEIVCDIVINWDELKHMWELYDYNFILVDTSLLNEVELHEFAIITKTEKFSQNKVVIIRVTKDDYDGFVEKIGEYVMDDFIVQPYIREDLYKVLLKNLHKENVEENIN